MSKITVDTIATTAGSLTTSSIQVSSWNHVDASTGTPVTQDSFNISSNTDVAVGRIGHNFTNNMANTAYSASGSGQYDTGGANFGTPNHGIPRFANMFLTTSGETALTVDGSTSLFDGTMHHSVFIGDLA